MRALIDDGEVLGAGEGEKLGEDWRGYQDAGSALSELLNEIGHPILSPRDR